MQYRFGFIGCGNMGGALVQAVAKAVAPEQIAVSDYDAQKVASFEKQLGVCAESTQNIARKCSFIVLGVKPQVLDEVLGELKPALEERETECVLISMAAGIPIAHIEQRLGRPSAVIRIMPNLCAAVGAGMILYASNAQVLPGQVSDFMAAFAPAGVLDAIDEDKIDAASAVSGCGPAFVDLFIEALADGAVLCGLTRKQALLYAEQTVMGTAKTLLESGVHPAVQKDAVCSPGGTTIAGVQALETGAFRASVMAAVGASYRRTLEMKKGK